MWTVDCCLLTALRSRMYWLWCTSSSTLHNNNIYVNMQFIGTHEQENQWRMRQISCFASTAEKRENRKKEGGRRKWAKRFYSWKGHSTKFETECVIIDSKMINCQSSSLGRSFGRRSQAENFKRNSMSLLRLIDIWHKIKYSKRNRHVRQNRMQSSFVMQCA